MTAAASRTDSIPFITLPNWVKAAAQCGFNIEPVFRAHGIATDLIHLETTRVSPRTMERLMEDCVARSRGAHFPYALGETFAFDYLPDLETFVSTSPTLREASRVFDWVEALINPLMRVRVEERGSKAFIVLDLAGDGGAVHLHFCEAFFAAVVKFGRALLHADAIGELRLIHRRPRHAAAAQAFFRIPVRYGARHNALVVDRALLDAPLHGAFPALHRQAEIRVEQRVGTVRSQPGLAAQVEDLLTRRNELLSDGLPAIAAALKLGPRTLQRRLRENGSSLAELVDRVSSRLAMRWLEEDDGISIDDISERLGFSDRRSFTRAFRRWSGLSPSAFRRKR